LLSEYADAKTDWGEISLSFDDERQCYLVVRVGWFQKYKRIHRCLAHIEIRGDLIVIQANNTEDPLDTALIDMGIPKEKICLGFIPPDFRAYTAQHAQPARENQMPVHSPSEPSRLPEGAVA
jgi:hypothetical protein